MHAKSNLTKKNCRRHEKGGSYKRHGSVTHSKINKYHKTNIIR